MATESRMDGGHYDARCCFLSACSYSYSLLDSCDVCQRNKALVVSELCYVVVYLMTAFRSERLCTVECDSSFIGNSKPEC
jgi:hypothetical protein